ncbi:MAG: LD-carboxypeptidase [Oscillospiraceae bacterium]|nr:LD-carboxypeptidase [Oscillospiraceae bacterium]
MTLIKPLKLNPGDKIATVSLAWGCAGEPDMRWRYDLGVLRLKSEFGLEAVAMPHSLESEDYIRNHPESRAEDLMTAFADPSVKGIIANIGGNDSIRLLPYIDFDVIQNNPKVFIGYSDILNIHLMCLKAGLTTFYGANLLTTIAEPQGLHPYSRYWLKKVLFDNQPIGCIAPPDKFTCDETEYANPNQVKQYHPHAGYECLQGFGRVTGRLFGVDKTNFAIIESAGLTEPLYENGNILFFEDIVECVSPDDFAEFFMCLAEKDITRNIKGVIIGRFNEYPENYDYRNALLKTTKKLNLPDLPVLFNLPFGHTSPICTLPFGAMAEIDCENGTFSILESGVV